MSRKKYRARDKSVNKLTRDGLVERNAATGEETRVSNRETELDLRGGSTERETYSQPPTPPIRLGGDPGGNTPAKKRKKGAYRQPEAASNLNQQTAPQNEPLQSDLPLTKRHETAVEQIGDTSDVPIHQPLNTPRTLAKSPDGRQKTQRNTAYRQAEPSVLQHETPTPDSSLTHERESALITERNTATADAPRSQAKPPGAKKHKPAYKPEPQQSAVDSASDVRAVTEPRTAEPNTTATPQADGKPDSMLKAKKSGKLQFTQDEKTPDDAKGKPNRKLAKAERGAEHANSKLEKAKDKLPAKRKLRSQRVFDEKSGKVKRKLNFEKEVISQRQHMKGALPLRPVKAGANALMLNAHRKIYQVEHENVGVKAAHRAEMFAEGGIRSALRFRKTAPYNKVAKLERKAAKKSINLTYQRALAENPKLKSSVLSRMAQKRKIKKQYAKAAREAQKSAKRAQKAASYTGRAAKAIAGVIRRHPVATAAVVLLALLLFMLMSLFGLAGGIGNGTFGGILTASYLAEDADIDNAELSYTEWETDLQFQIANTESAYPGYDEYRYNIGDISHNPYELMAYLTVMYENFPYDAISGELRALFDAQYMLTFTPTTETRYADPTDANDDGDYEPYEWKILTVTLTARSFSEIITPRMDADQLQHYTVLMQSKGSRQYLGNPFGDMDWLPYVTSYYGWRVHPISGAKDLHRGIDIGLPSGIEIRSGQDGTVTFAGYSGDYGNVVIIENDKGLVSKYAHCDTLLVSVGQTVTMGDVIATVGSTGNSTGPHLHLEVMKDGIYINPIFFADTGNFGAFGGINYPEYPGEPVSDEMFAAMLEVAQAQIGKPYIWGASGPNSFDCSGLICYVINQSGVGNIGRIGAQAIYNLCTPVQEPMPGDLIFFHSTYDAPQPVTHIGMYVGNGYFIHAGNPVKYSSVNTPYYTEHFYAYARLPFGG